MPLQFLKSRNCKLGKIETNIVKLSSLKHELQAKRRDVNLGLTTKFINELEFSTLFFLCEFHSNGGGEGGNPNKIYRRVNAECGVR